MNATAKRLAWIPLLAVVIWGTARTCDVVTPAPLAERPGDPWNPPILVNLTGLTVRESLPLAIHGSYRLLTTEDEPKVIYEDVGFEGDLTFDAAGIRLGQIHGDRDHLWIEPAGNEALRLDDLTYDGRLRLDLERSRSGMPKSLRLSLELPLESYVLGVVCGEMSTMTPGIHEALRAQAIAARSYALWRLGQGRLLRDNTSDQVFRGADFLTKEARRAVQETRGLVVFWDGTLLPSYFHSDCGGGTTNALEAGFTKKELAPLVGVADANCATRYEWQRQVPASRFDGLAKRHEIGTWLRAIQALSKDPYGRMQHVRLLGEEDHFDLPADQVRAGLRLPSSHWTETKLQRDGSMVISGRGNGHGVGMCQKGAMRFAEEGLSAEEIIAHYYPGAALHRLSTADQKLLP